MPFEFELIHVCKQSGARRGRFRTPHGIVETPAYMPVGTQGTVKAVPPWELKALGAGMILSNTYHLHLRPGEDVVAEAGGLHRFIGWDGPILTDSGGYQVFSLSKLSKISDEGVSFRSHLDGSARFLTPEAAVAIQERLGSDVAMQLDECAPWPCDRERAERALRRTIEWHGRSVTAKRRGDQALFPIVQGSSFPELRREGARAAARSDPPGFGIGGLSVGEPKPIMYEMIEAVRPELPPERPRYLMGVGSPDCLIEGAIRGIDLFDCVLATRIARNGTAFTKRGRLIVKSARYERDFAPIEGDCDCAACRGSSRAYLRHLFKANEVLALTLLSLHNLRFLTRLMEGLREAIEADASLDFAERFYRTHPRGRW